MIQIAVVGCGSTGLFLAAGLAASGYKPILFCSHDEAVAAIAANGIRVVGHGEAYARVSAAHVSLAQPQYKLAFLAFRLNGLREGLKVASQLLSSDALGIVLLQPSPLALEEAESAGFPIAGFLHLGTCVWKITSSTVEWSGNGFAVFAGLNDAGRVVMDIAKVYRLDARLYGSEKIGSVAWDALSVAASVQPVSALLGGCSIKAR
ncbi:ketopantoate reductase family protein [Hyperthermus butylicus]|uniref:Ketopantoate reductase N-terminal domain-containing protein n=1 Tax=Hyperthermus butylicus (strain DSM 5456 / JCM 9403 / PLM1-5) TaxID=415426 RepID=A2BK11_HYPBU|nr:2-dehydropantoate 2-reductase N-terminal domain-containing protein [Hyperthermus butylicus]ABM80322.1 hypothetical protein Hbut_0456 [Hyperthermus butylicus DSM 5456]